MTDDSRAVIFGRDAAAYEDARPTYPEAATELVASLVAAESAVEVGAGTGKATRAIAREGLHLKCLEPSPEMAAVLESKGYPGVEVVVTRLEEWDGSPESQDLLYAAQAWHWVDPERGFAKAMSVLRPGGAIALIWNIPVDRYGRHREIYTRYGPHLLTEDDERIRRRDHHDWTADMAEAGFVDVERATHPWSEELDAGGYRALFSTYSDHMMLDEPMRTQLLDGLAADVEGWGGKALVEYRCEVFTGRKPDTGQH